MRIIFICMGFLVFGLVGGFFLFQQFDHKVSPTYAITSHCPYIFLNPLRCEPELAVQKKEYVALRNELTEYIEEEKKKGHASFVSVYFRDLQNGPTMGIDGQENFAPASLLKVPLMITYYKKAQDNPEILKRKVTVASDIASLHQNVLPKESALPGKEYQLQDLFSLLITNSDNIAWAAILADLRKYYSEEDFVMTLSDLGIIDPRARGDQDVTVQAYASIFRILYNSSYLNLDMSNKALELLSRSTFKDGLVDGVPEGTRVAHKFGEYRNGEEQQLHDCGIVYYPQNPYLICVMTKGNSIAELLPIIQYVSKEVYQEVASRNN